MTDLLKDLASDLWTEDEQPALIAEFLQVQVGRLREKGFTDHAITSALLGCGLEGMIAAEGIDDVALWLVGIAGKLKGIPDDSEVSH